MIRPWTLLREWPLWSFVFVQECDYCGKLLARDAIRFCDGCWANLPRAEKQTTDKLPKFVDGLHAGFAFREGNVTREIVHALKFGGMVELAPRMADMLSRTIPLGFLDSADVMAPVPLHWLRRGDRSFNQSMALACELSLRTGCSVAEPLKRIRNTPAQSGQGVRTRAANVKDAFSIRRDAKLAESVLLIDDVVTTGATVSECAKVLKQAGVKRVRVLAFSHAE